MIYKALIVEDEPPIRRKIADMVNRSGLFTVTDTVSNGLLARDAILRNPPDLLITDIHLPVMDGIELIAWVREQNYDMDILVISGYDKFEYAQKSLSYNVHAYLLKPIDAKHFHTCLQNISESILKRVCVKGSKWLANSLLNSESLDFPSPGTFRMCLLCAGSFPLSVKIDVPHEYGFLKSPFFESCFHQKEPTLLWRATGFTRLEEVLLLFGTPAETESCLRKAFQLLCHQSLPVTMVYSGPCNCLHSISTLHRLLRDRMEQAARFAESHCESLEDNFTLDIPDSGADSATHNIRYGSSEDFCRDLTLCLNLRGKHPLHTKTIYRTLLQIYGQLLTELEISNASVREQIRSSIAEMLTLTHDRDSLISGLKALADDLFLMKYPEDMQIIGSQVSIEKAQRYIEAHFCERITGQSVAALFNYSSVYFSRIFFKQYGITPTNYITELRIRKAEKLLQSQPELSLKQISALVGYDDPFYFSKRFKKLIGCSPSEYRTFRDDIDSPKS